MDSGIDFCHAQFLEGGAVRAVWPWIHLHLSPSPSDRLESAAEKCPQKMHLSQPILPQLLKGLVQGLQLAEVLPYQVISPGG
jgi:hypothetical protein